MQSLSYTAQPKIIQTPDNQNNKSRLYVTPRTQKTSEDPAAEPPADDPLGLGQRDLDENAQKEMDRVFALYKELSKQQSEKAARKPLKTEPTKTKPDANSLRTLTPSKQQQTQQASPGSFAGILERYQQKKSEGTATNVLNITDPEDLERQTTSSGNTDGYNE